MGIFQIAYDALILLARYPSTLLILMAICIILASILSKPEAKFWRRLWCKAFKEIAVLCVPAFIFLYWFTPSPDACFSYRASGHATIKSVQVKQKAHSLEINFTFSPNNQGLHTTNHVSRHQSFATLYDHWLRWFKQQHPPTLNTSCKIAARQSIDSIRKQYQLYANSRIKASIETYGSGGCYIPTTIINLPCVSPEAEQKINLIEAAQPKH